MEEQGDDELCRLEFLSYTMIWQHDSVHTEFEKCAREYLNNDDVKIRVYREGFSQAEFSASLEEVILPIF